MFQTVYGSLYKFPALQERQLGPTPTYTFSRQDMPVFVLNLDRRVDRLRTLTARGGGFRAAVLNIMVPDSWYSYSIIYLIYTQDLPTTLY